MPIVIAVVFIVILVVFLNSVSNVVDFIYFPSLIFVFGSYALILLSSQNFKSFYDGLKILVKRESAISSEMIDNAIDAFTLLEKASVGIGIVGFLLCSTFDCHFKPWSLDIKKGQKRKIKKLISYSIKTFSESIEETGYKIKIVEKIGEYTRVNRNYFQSNRMLESKIKTKKLIRPL